MSEHRLVPPYSVVPFLSAHGYVFAWDVVNADGEPVRAFPPYDYDRAARFANAGCVDVPVAS